MKDSDYLYIFLHIPKTAGLTFRYHIEKNLKRHERLLINLDNFGIRKEFPGLNYQKYKSFADKYFSSLSENKKNKIKVIYGHYVPYGIHKHFKKPARYITFVRNPVARTVSIYNDKRRHYEKNMHVSGIRRNIINTFLINGRLPSFVKWLEVKYPADNAKGQFLTMTGFLKMFGYLVKGGVNKKLISSALDKFYFIGLTDKYGEDSLYFYNKLGINIYFKNKNVSTKYFDIDKNKHLLLKIMKKNKLDQIIFEEAVKKNKDFKKKNKDFFVIVEKKRKMRKIILPFTQTFFAPKDTLKFLLGQNQV